MNDTIIPLPDTYLQLSAYRNEDTYLPDMNWHGIVTDFFPPSVPELVQRLSDITGAFYGGLLKQAGDLFGQDKIDTLSRAFLYDLGLKTATRNISAKPHLTPGLPGMFKVLIGTVFTSSPEFKFEVLELNEERGKMVVKGTDRYHKIAMALGIADQLQWPVILPFVKGVSDGMGLSCTISMTTRQLNEQSECIYDLTVSVSR